MPGVVEKLLVSVGSVVKAGDVLCTVSAMKMEVGTFVCNFVVAQCLNFGVY